MKEIKFAIAIVVVLVSKVSYSQTKEGITLDEVVISANKTEESKKKVAQQIEVLTEKEIAGAQAQTTADLLANTGNIFIQKSQQGGGSVTLRGFEANRTLLLIDGVRMNNIIYRSGHLQNIVTTDNTSLARVEILFGSSSTIYGSDALGGVVHLYTKDPELSLGDKNKIGATIVSRYGSVNDESKNHFDFSFGMKKIASLTSFTYSGFGDLKSGKNRNPFHKEAYGERPSYVERRDGTDVLVKNPNPYRQVPSGYSQYDLMQKFLFQQNQEVAHRLNIQYSNSTDVPRYDRLTDTSSKGLKYAEWYYGPQSRLLTAYDLTVKKEEGAFQNIHFGVNYQNAIESRHTRKFGSDDLSHRKENVHVIGANLDFQKNKEEHTIRFGFDGQFNTLKSTANSENITTGAIEALDTRYPDGDNTMVNVALYFSHTWTINQKLTLVDGARLGFVSLHSTFVRPSFFTTLFPEVNQNNPVYSGNIGLIHTPSEDWKLSALVSTGYRVPNVDDLSKIFDSAKGTVIVPNADIKPEKTINIELGVTKIFTKKVRWENTIYYTHFKDAIVTDKFTLNGQDSIMYDGVMSQVFANQNKKVAYIYGFSSNIKSKIGKKITLDLMVNYTYGRIKTEGEDAPLDHIPPFMTRISSSYTNKKFSSTFFINYNGWKKLKNYYLNGEDNEQYATEEGMPAWFTLNLRSSYQVHKFVLIEAGIDNMLDTQYRTFASGINSPGRNIFGSLKFHL